MYTDGQIITKAEHIAFANWNNANGGKFQTIPNGDDTYTIKEIVIPAPTPKQLAEQRIAELKRLLADSDYAVIKIAEGVATKEEYVEVLANRSAWRAKINELELVVDNTNATL